ncbi:MAG: O-antigen ligase family protein [Candidatus Woesearchaeota archaeon]
MEKNNIIKELIFILAIIWMGFLGNYFYTLSWIFLIFYSLRDKESAIKALLIGVILNYLNPLIFPLSEYGGLLKWGLLFIASGKILLSTNINLKENKWIVPLYIFSLFSFLASLLNSSLIFISIAKIATFTLGITVLLIGIKNTKKSFIPFLISLSYSFILSSIPFIFISSGYIEGHGFFKGIINHSQALGVLLVFPFIIFSYFWINKKYGLHSKIISTLSAILLYLTWSRTAIFSIIIGLSLSYFYISFKNKSLKLNKKIVVFILLILTISSFFIVFQNPNLDEDLYGYITKERGVEGNIINRIYKHRSHLIESSMENFREEPLIGNGFGIYPGKEYEEEIVLKAPTEKGNIITSLLEEVGIFGLILFSIFIISLLKSFKKMNLLNLWVFSSVFLIQLGEMNFFSAGGLGIFLWFFLGLSLNDKIDNQNNNNNNN